MSDPDFSIEDRPHTVREVAQLFHVTEYTVRMWIKDGKLAAIKPLGTRAWQITRSAMVRFVNNEFGDK